MAEQMEAALAPREGQAGRGSPLEAGRSMVTDTLSILPSSPSGSAPRILSFARLDDSRSLAYLFERGKHLDVNVGRDVARFLCL